MPAPTADEAPVTPVATTQTATSSEEADRWGRDSFPASDPPQNW
jgi:hypothetical protein